MINRLPYASLFIVLVLYPLAAWLALRISPQRQKSWWFAMVNVAGAYLACVAAMVQPQAPVKPVLDLMKIGGAGFLGYLAFLLISYWLLRRSKLGGGWGAAALWFPVAALIIVKYVPPVQNSFHSILSNIAINRFSILFLGLSYLTFRLCLLVQEVRNELVEMPSVADYLSFAFFVPTLSLGPINPYSKFIQSYRNPDRTKTPVNRSLLRIIVGLTKYLFLSALVNQYSYSGLLLDGHPHAKVDLLIALFSYTVYLYCNFSGFCDIAIGVSGLLGIEVMENFDRPFSARNLQEFWTKWHVSLSTWLRDMMFTPFVKALVKFFGPRSANHAIAFSLCFVFVVIGLWHGFGINFALFGLIQGIGLATVHYYTIFLKRKLGKDGFAAYRSNGLISAAGTVITFVYFSLSLFFFANSWENINQIFECLV